MADAMTEQQTMKTKTELLTYRRVGNRVVPTVRVVFMTATRIDAVKTYPLRWTELAVLPYAVPEQRLDQVANQRARLIRAGLITPKAA